MILSDEFRQILISRLKDKNNDLLTLRELLADFKKRGLDKESMLRSLEELRAGCDEQDEDILLELMDFVTGFCNPQQRIF